MLQMPTVLQGLLNLLSSDTASPAAVDAAAATLQCLCEVGAVGNRHIRHVASRPGAIECLNRRLQAALVQQQQQQQQGVSVEAFRVAEQVARCLGLLDHNCLVRQSIVTQHPEVLTSLQKLAEQKQQQQQSGNMLNSSSSGRGLGSGGVACWRASAGSSLQQCKLQHLLLPPEQTGRCSSCAGSLRLFCHP
jgi:hypothetical protein